MHLGLISSRFTPETSPCAKRVTDLAEALQAAGHRTTVLTQLPHYPDINSYADFPCDEGPRTVRRDDAGNEVWRFRPQLVAKGNLRARLMAEARFAYRTSRRSTDLSDFDGVFATSPYMFSLWTAGTYRVPTWLDLRDLTWEYSRELGPQNMVHRIGYCVLKSLAVRCFRAAARVSTTTERQRQYLIDRGVPPASVEVVPNGVPTRIVDDLGRMQDRPRSDGPLRVVYAGLLGFPQGLSFAVESMEDIPANEVELHMYGEGVDRPALMNYCRSRKLGHIHFHGHVPYEQYLRALGQADILYASLRPGGSLVAAMPSKLWEYMAAAKPVLFAGSGEAAEAIERAGAGVSVPYGAKADFQAAIRRFQKDEEYCRQCGENGRSWVINHQLREMINARWVETMTEVFRSPTRRNVRRHARMTVAMEQSRQPATRAG